MKAGRVRTRIKRKKEAITCTVCTRRTLPSVRKSSELPRSQKTRLSRSRRCCPVTLFAMDAPATQFTDAEDDDKDAVQLQLEQASKASAGLDGEGFCPREDARSQEHGIDTGGFAMERPVEGCTGNDEHEEESEDFRGDSTFLEMSSERLSTRVQKMTERMGEDLLKMLQKSEENMNRASEHRNAVLQHGQQHAQKIQLAKRALLDIYEKYSQESE